MATGLPITSPLSSGDIVGRAFRIFRANLGTIARILVLPTILLCIGKSLLVIAGASLTAASGFTASLAWAPAGIAGFILAIFGGIMLYLRQLALVRYFTGFASSTLEAAAYMKKRWTSMIGISLATGTMIIMGAVVWTVLIGLSVPFLKNSGPPAIIASAIIAIGVLGFLTTLFYLSIVATLSMTGLAIEQGDISSIMSRAFALSGRSFFRSSGFLSLATLAISLIAYPLSLPIVLISFAYAVFHGVSTGDYTSAQTQPLALQVLTQTWETVVSMIVGPVYHFAFGLYYCDLKMRQEGLDIVRRLDEVEGTQLEGSTR